MEQDKQNLLEMIDRPAFLVQDGLITDCNQMAKNRQIQAGTPIAKLLPEECDAYQNYNGGILYLTMQIGWIQCGATVVRQSDGDLFLMDRDADQAQLQALALAAQHGCCANGSESDGIAGLYFSGKTGIGLGCFVCRKAEQGRRRADRIF